MDPSIDGFKFRKQATIIGRSAQSIIEDPVTAFDSVAVGIGGIESGVGPIGIAAAGVSAHSFVIVGCDYAARTGTAFSAA